MDSGTSQDLATAIDQLAGVAPPAKLAGIDRNAELSRLGSVGVYGRGVTEFVAVPLPGRAAYSLRRQFSSVNSATGSAGTDDPDPNLAVAVGPLNLLLSDSDGFGNAWLLVGTVQADVLTAAAGELPAHPELP